MSLLAVASARLFALNRALKYCRFLDYKSSGAAATEKVAALVAALLNSAVVPITDHMSQFC